MGYAEWHGGENTDMRVDLVRWPVPTALRGDVLRFTGYAEQLQAPVTYRYPPGTFVPVIVNVGSPYRVIDESGAQEYGSFTAGLGTGSTDVQSTCSALCVQIDVSPLAACRLLRVPMHELTGRVVALDDVLGRDALELEERLANARSWGQRRELAEAFLVRRLLEAPPLPADVEYAWGRLGETGGSIRVRELAAELRCSRKHLDARFREAVGVPPKTAAALIRFNRALGLLEAGEKPADVAHRCGYADQPHFTREFRRFTGTTPVAFLQDATAAAA
jgi:AraC-like DNA-binding protein